jgi:hypothetical protein
MGTCALPIIQKDNLSPCLTLDRLLVHLKKLKRPSESYHKETPVPKRQQKGTMKIQKEHYLVHRVPKQLVDINVGVHK